MKLVFFGLSLSSSWGNGHATTYRALLRALHARGHEIVFLERDVPWYATARDLTKPEFCELHLYEKLTEIPRGLLENADAFVIGSYVEETDELVRSLAQVFPTIPRLYYDIDTPVTVRQLEADTCPYLSRATVRLFDIYFTFSGGPVMDVLRTRFGARDVRLLGCSVDTQQYRPVDEPRQYALGYLGTYDESRQPMLERLLFAPAEALPHLDFVLAGSMFPDTMRAPSNVTRIEHIPPAQHRKFYGGLEFALNVTRRDMVEAGFSPSVRMFEAAACGATVITDPWRGLETFFEPGKEVLVASSTDDLIAFLQMPPEQRDAVADAGLQRIRTEHSSGHRAAVFEAALREWVQPQAGAERAAL